MVRRAEARRLHFDAIARQMVRLCFAGVVGKMRPFVPAMGHIAKQVVVKRVFGMEACGWPEPFGELFGGNLRSIVCRPRRTRIRG